MTKSLLEDAFAHHVWATLKLMDTCSTLTPEQMSAGAPGTFGSIIDTMRHLVGADSSYLSVTNGGKTPMLDEEAMDLSELRAVMEGHAAAWSSLLAENPDPEAVIVRHRDDGTDSHAPMAIRLAQVVHHGTDHRSHICTVLTTLGVQPPDIDVWDFGSEGGRVFETEATS
jgi:uncharacterized damage-inducible protein DinB